MLHEGPASNSSRRPLTAARASGYCSEQEQLEKWRPHAGATHTTREFFRSYEDAAKQAKETAQAVAQQVKILRADDVIKPEILRQRVADAIAEGRAAVQKHQDRMEALARRPQSGTELRLILDGSADPVAHHPFGP